MTKASPMNFCRPLTFPNISRFYISEQYIISNNIHVRRESISGFSHSRKEILVLNQHNRSIFRLQHRCLISRVFINILVWHELVLWSPTALTVRLLQEKLDHFNFNKPLLELTQNIGFQKGTSTENDDINSKFLKGGCFTAAH